MKVAFKLASAMILGICVVLIICGHPQVEQVTNRFEAAMRSDQQAIGLALRSMVARTWQREGEAGAVELVEQINQMLARQSTSAIAQIRLVWLDARPGNGEGPRVASEHLGAVRRGMAVSAASRDTGRLYTYIPLHETQGNEGPVVLEIAGSPAPVRGFARDTRRGVLATTLVVTGICGLLAMVAGAYFVGRPVRKLVRVARRMSDGDLGARVEEHGRDELGVLARAMNRMGNALVAARTDLDVEIQERARSVDQLRHADRLSSVGTLASGIAHELGTPLAVISGRAELIAGNPEAAQVEEHAQCIIKQADKMTGIIRQLLDFARRRKTTLSPKDVTKLTEMTVRLLRSLAAKKNIAIELRAPDEPILAAVDAVQLQQVLTNLIVNAVQAMPLSGTITVGVEQRWAAPPTGHEGHEGTHVHMYVQDQGAGIPEAIRDKIFEPFFTTKPVGQGTGLGLAVSYGIIQEHGGWFDVESEAGKGSRFSMYIPMPEGMAPRAKNDARG